MADLRIDLNADLGEGFGVWRLGDDEALLDLITSANVACGFHAGDPTTMLRVCRAAAERDVAIGAQVSYRDLVGFGRRRIDYDVAELTADIVYQLAALDGIARTVGSRVRYVKAHGALYNVAADDPVQAGAIVAAVLAYDACLPVLGLPGSALADASAVTGVEFVAEAFADRAYSPAGRLVPRSEPDAVITDVDTVVARSVRIAREGRVTATDGTEVAVAARSLCLHGDTPGAVALAHAVRAALTGAGVGLAPYVA